VAQNIAKISDPCIKVINQSSHDAECRMLIVKTFDRRAKPVTLAICCIYGAVFTHTFQRALLWLNGGLDICTDVMLQ